MSEPRASRARLTAAFLTCTAIWGSTFLVIRIGNESIPPFWGAAMRLFIASALLWGWMLLRRQPAPRGPALVSAAQYGSLQFGVNFALLYWGETAVPSGLSAVMYATVPLTTSLLARAYGLERLTRGKIVAAISALLGVVIIFASELSGRMPALPLCAIFVSATSACWGSVLLKRGPAQSAIGVNAVGTAIGFVVCLLLSFVAGESHALPHTTVGIFSVLYLVVAGSLTAFVLWSWLVLHATISRISYIAVLVPLCALVLGAVAVHEHLPGWTLAGAAVVLIGVILGLRAPAARTR